MRASSRKIKTHCTYYINASTFVKKKNLNKIIVVTFRSGRIYVVDTQKNPRAPSLHKVVEPADIVQKT